MSTALHHLATSSGVLFGTSGARGLVVQMSDAICYAYTQAFIRIVAAETNRVVIGHDLRPSSPVMAAACAQAVKDASMGVVFVGLMPTPGVAYYASLLHAPAIIITGSHIPFDRNGIKFYRTDGEISKADEQAMLETTVDVPADLASMLSNKPLPVATTSACAAYADRYVAFFGRGALQGTCIAIYDHSSVARDILRSVLESLGASVISLGRTDSFVSIDTEAVRPEDVVQARQWAIEHNFDAILSTDGDADRPLIGDEQGNWLRGDVVVHATSRLVSLVGVANLIVIEPPDAVLVADKTCSQDVKHIVTQLQKEGREEHTLHRKVHRPWGWYDSIDEGGRFKVKRIQVKPKASLSLQKHHHRAEHWIVVKGTAEITNGDKTILLTENQSTCIPLGETHRLANPGTIPLEIIEVQSGSYLGEDDIVRFEDSYGRTQP